MHKICINMQKYAVTPLVFILCIHMHLYSQNMEIYAKYVSMKFICKICTPHFADVVLPRGAGVFGRLGSS